MLEAVPCSAGPGRLPWHDGGVSQLDATTCRTLAATVPDARLATLRPDGRIDLVPIVFAFADDRLVFAVDHKPKTTHRLQRLVNIAANPEVTVLFDRYHDDWRRLWWVRMRGLASELGEGEPAERAIDALAARHPQYAERPPAGPVVAVAPIEWKGWAAAELTGA